MFASITIVGRLINDPELRTDDFDGKVVLRGLGCLSVTRRAKPKPGNKYPDSDLFNFEALPHESESLVNNCRKGSHILVQGTPEQYTTKQGEKRWVIRRATWRFVGPAPSERQSSDIYVDDIGF